MDEQRQPGISFDGIILVKENLWRDYSVPESAVPELSFGTSWNHHDGRWLMELSFALRLVVDGRDVLRLEGAFVGFFSVIKGSENMEMERFMEAHAPALMFPYIREHISTVTQKAGVKPVLLPPLNIKALVKTAEERPDHSAQVCISKSREDT